MYKLCLSRLQAKKQIKAIISPYVRRTKYHYYSGGGRFKTRVWLIVPPVLALVFAGYFFINTSRVDAPGQTPTAKKPLAKISEPQKIEGRYLLNGTVVWARAVERDSQKPDGGYDYTHPFSRLNTFNRADYDAWTADFECPITNNTVPYSVQANQLVFNCQPEFLPEAAKFFDIFDLANNHTDNQGGIKGLEETRQHLKNNGLQYFGSFDPGVANDVCEVVALPLRVQKSDKTEEKAKLPVAFCAWHYFYRKPLPGEVEAMQKYAIVMPVFAFAEMGTEYQPSADSIQQAIAHQIIDQGPEFLVANNPHWVQNSEVYKNKLIVYSTGNFIFDQIDPETQRSASIDLLISAKYSDNLAKWLKLGPECLNFQDSCLERARQLGLTKPKLELKYGVVAGQGGAGKVTHRADAATQKAVEERLNWSQTCQALGYNACQ